jgi:hypothetical protein
LVITNGAELKSSKYNINFMFAKDNYKYYKVEEEYNDNNIYNVVLENKTYCIYNSLDHDIIIYVAHL